nr:hypothetical protein [Tanacetum cinerariifolium]
LKKFTEEPALDYLPPLGDDDDDNADLFVLKFDNNEWKNILYGDCYKDINSEKDKNKDSKMKSLLVEAHIIESNDLLPQLLDNDLTLLEDSSDYAFLSSSPFGNEDKTCLMPLAIKTQNNSFLFVHEIKQEMHNDLKYVESLEKEIDKLEFDQAEFSNMYDMILQEYLKAQLQDKNIAISEMKKLIEKGKGKSVDTMFDKPYVVRQPNAQRIPKPSVLELNSRASAQKKDAQSLKKTKRYMPVEKKYDSKKHDRQISIGQKLSPNKSSTMYLKTMPPRSCLRWKPTGRIFKTVGLRWVPTGKIFTFSTTKVDSEPPNGLNADITNQYECKQTLDVSACSLLKLKNTKKRTKSDQSRQKQEAWRSLEKSEAVTVSKGRKTEQKAKTRAEIANTCKVLLKKE